MFPFGYPEAWLLEVFGAQNWSFCRSPISFIKFLNPNLQEFWVVHWKPTNKMINFKIFNISVVSLKMMIFFISWQSVLFRLQNMQHETGSPNSVWMLPFFKETLKPVRSKHSSLNWLEHNTLRLFGCQFRRFRFSNHFSNTSESFQGNLMKEIKIVKRIY